MYFPTLILLLHSDGAIGRALSYPAFRYIATLGYGVYLVHIPLVDQLVVPWAHHFDRRVAKPLLWGGAFAVTMIGSLALAYVLHVLVEKPFLRLRDRLTA